MLVSGAQSQQTRPPNITTTQPARAALMPALAATTGSRKVLPADPIRLPAVATPEARRSAGQFGRVDEFQVHRGGQDEREGGEQDD